MPRDTLFLVGDMKNQILGSKLPSKQDVLSVLFYNMRKLKLSLANSVSLVIDECMIFWKKARIPTRDRCHCLKQLKKLYEELRSLKKSKYRNTETSKKKETLFSEKLNDLFDIAHANALTSIKIEEDKQFLLMQRQEGRPGCMLGIDRKLAGIEKRKKVREIKSKQRAEAQSSSYLHEEKLRLSFSSVEDEFDIESDCNSVFPNPAQEPSCSKRARMELLTPRLSAALDKCKISDRDAVHLLTACVEATSINPSKFVINRSSLRLARQYFREKTDKEGKKAFLDLNLGFSVIHWDSKLLPDITGQAKVDRLPVIATAPKVEQLLGVPELPAGTGIEVSSAVYEVLEDWGLVDKVQAFVFDTTASNTGRLNGACVLLESKIGRDILYLACRHHIFEIILQAVFVGSKFDPSSSPDIPLFKRFKTQWKTIDKRRFCVWSIDETAVSVLANVRQEILLFAISKLEENFPRDDYKEFLELIVIYLGGISPGGINFREPGAYHLARWMAKGIYCLKILLFQQQVKLTTSDKNALSTICCFIVKCYAQSWFSAPNVVQAPLNDIYFLKRLNSYKDDDKIIAEIAIKKFINHLWYLNEECAAFSFFDDRLSLEEKRNMVLKVLEDDDQKEEEVKKKFYLKPADVSHFITKSLPSELLSSKSLKMFERFGLSTNFLHIDPILWNDQLDYVRGKEIIASLNVVNDAAERGVKLMEEFNTKLTKYEDQKQFLLQTVQNYRKKYPGFSRKSLETSYDD